MAVPWLKAGRLRGTCRPAGASLVVPIGHCLVLPQIQPDGVTLKYNDYAWNKVRAQALQPSTAVGRGWL